MDISPSTVEAAHARWTNLAPVAPAWMQWPDRQTPGNTLLLLLHLAQSISWTQIAVLLAVIWWMRSVHSIR